MEKKPWRALKSCKRKRFKANWGRRKDRLSEPQCFKANWGPRKDRLSELPDDILLSILYMASFTLKAAARTSLLSHRWRNLWRSFPVLNFEDLREEKVKMGHEVPDAILCLEKDNFVKWVNCLSQDHLCQSIDEFRVAFDLEDGYQCHIDKWVAFVSEKKVKRLELDFRPTHYKSFSTCKPELPHNSGSIMSTLTSLRLIYVRVTAQVIECLLDSCPLLENLYIQKSENLTSIRASSSSLTLKHLEVVQCYSMEAVDISAPNLLSFRYNGPRIELHIRNGSSLSEVMFGSWDSAISINYALDSLSKYFPQLESLSLRIAICRELNMGINYAPALTKLKHLELLVKAWSKQSLLGWIRIIEASPVLQKLTLKFTGGDFPSRRPIVRRRCRRFFKCLKTLEIDGFLGLPIDLEMAIYVFKHAPMLEEVIVDVTDPFEPTSKANQNALERLYRLEREIPKAVELYLKK